MSEPTPSLRIGQGLFRVSGVFAIVDADLKPHGEAPIVDPQKGEPAEILIRGLAPEDWEAARLQAVAAREWHQAQANQSGEGG
jgi:hypothetical protein